MFPSISFPYFCLHRQFLLLQEFFLSAFLNFLKFLMSVMRDIEVEDILYQISGFEYRYNFIYTPISTLHSPKSKFHLVHFEYTGVKCTCTLRRGWILIMDWAML